MRDAFAAGSLLAFVLMVPIMGIGIAIGGCLRDQHWKSEIIARGCAEWTVDPKTGRTEWQWICGSEPKGGE